ncbi:MAG: hypothetical protein ACWGMY_08805, partial [Hyphomicrobiaceae bacterium]
MVAALVAFCLTAECHPAQAGETQTVDHDSASVDAGSPELTLDNFLDRLVLAESGGDDQARNSRSTA